MILKLHSLNSMLLLWIRKIYDLNINVWYQYRIHIKYCIYSEALHICERLFFYRDSLIINDSFCDSHYVICSNYEMYYYSKYGRIKSKYI